ncbi:hypothetical protein ACFQ4C_21055 [Larkinella insperata]|uniref:KTSC domain-containing protein n=1 Tax=Larkinella insperata TaxID=332158 RepID=A0ABW3QNK2_9BACT
MNPDQLTTILLFAGFNEVTLPEGARLLDVHVDGYQVSLAFKTSASAPSVYRQFYVAFNSAPTDYTQGVLRLIKKIDFADGTSTAMIYEVYPYDEEV